MEETIERMAKHILFTDKEYEDREYCKSRKGQSCENRSCIDCIKEYFSKEDK